MSSPKPAKPVLAIDLDEVLGQFVVAICLWHNRRFNTSLISSDFVSYHFAAVTGWGSDAQAAGKVREFLSGPAGDTGIEGPAPEFLAVQPVAGAHAALSALQHLFDLVVVTARSEDIGVVTREWLAAHFPGIFSRIILCNAYGSDGHHVRRSKGDVCKEIGAVALVDDNVGYCLDAARAVPLAFLFGDYAWNTRKGGSWEHAPPPLTTKFTPTIAGGGAGAAPASLLQVGAATSHNIMAVEFTLLAPNVIRVSNWPHATALLKRLASALSCGEGAHGLLPLVGDSVLELIGPVATAVLATRAALVAQMTLRVRANDKDTLTAVCEELTCAGANVVLFQDGLTADITRTLALLESIIAAL